MNETITITRETYNLINEFVELLNEKSDYWIEQANIHKELQDTASVDTARWASAYAVKEAIDGDTDALRKKINFDRVMFNYKK